ncbi:unnamed protein product [Cylicocyclus nassatus]|uniref:ADP-ribosylation factor-like protein 6 n=1 Tax=Cylicocyclus nassatus TaxID=53992 RepID=A0AA36DQW1_CYLNA|nr:unnamed protein product [Cylicocyclus nassatus]
MGRVVSRFRYWLFGPKLCRVLMLGLPNSGKSTILRRLKNGDIDNDIEEPTGFNVETVKYRDVAFTIWDMGGDHKVRNIWKHYYSSVKLTIFVVDSSDIKGLREAMQELSDLLQVPDLKGISLLILANKQDLIGSLNADEIAQELKLRNIKDREWRLQLTSGLYGEGLKRTLEWMYARIKG